MYQLFSNSPLVHTLIFKALQNSYTGFATVSYIQGIQHERFVYYVIRGILEPPFKEQDLEDLHSRDEATKWFGVEKSEQSGETGFDETDRFVSLLASSPKQAGTRRYPQLVSFIGDTNAGKSTVVKTLIALAELDSNLPKDQFDSPVPGGRANEQHATSEGVHLYADPQSFQDQCPVLFADCEGLHAGEVTPYALSTVRKNRLTVAKTPASAKAWAMKRVHYPSRKVLWADQAKETATRDYAVRNLYPRLLYTFSDVVVFVQKNPKQLHITLKLLLEWGNAWLEKSLNQPVLPHAILVLNAVDVGDEDDRWDVDKATAELLKSAQALFEQEPFFREYKNLWQESHGVRINSAEEMLLRYYSSIRLIRVPQKSEKTYMLIHDQVMKLKTAIISGCEKARFDKRAARRLCTEDQLEEYLSAAFEHFRKKLHEPFDFVKVSLRSAHLQVARDFHDHICTLASLVQEGVVQTRQNVKGQDLFLGMSVLVASCIVLDTVREKRPGLFDEWFESHYEQSCKTALTSFCQTKWRCEFRTQKRNKELRCKNLKSGHAKGHQDGNGKIIGTGSYQSEFSPEQFSSVWTTQIKVELRKLEQTFREKRTQSANLYKDESDDAFDMHRSQVEEYYSQGLRGKYLTNATCLCCLMHTPEFFLSCGHALCAQCVRGYDNKVQDGLITIEGCPFHSKESIESRQISHLKTKPVLAGVRVLTLDGGGIRGIVELEVLRQIENYINKNASPGIDIQRFFDLVVGTSTGGIIALGLVASQWTVGDCIDKFLTLGSDAFTHREAANMPLLEGLTTLIHRSKYKTKPLRNALRDTLGDSQLFGWPQGHRTASATKVAVTSTLHRRTHDQNKLIANYIRQDYDTREYELEYSADPRDAFSIWEAAAATSAAPSFFKPYVKEVNGSKSFYLDGALYFNNPVKAADNERRLIWPDVADKHPDIILSLGTGQDESAIQQELRAVDEHLENETSCPRPDKLTGARWLKTFGVGRRLLEVLEVLVNRMDSILDTEQEWNAFRDSAIPDRGNTVDADRYIRFNVDLGRTPPRLDEKSQMKALQKEVDQRLQTDEGRLRVQKIAHRLISSSFYLERSGVLEKDKFGLFDLGHIKCRFTTVSDLRILTNFVHDQIVDSFQPAFVFEHPDFRHSLDFDQHRVDTMRKGRFLPLRIQSPKFDNAKPLSAFLRLREPTDRELKPQIKDYPLGGFPRTFAQEEDKLLSISQRRQSALRKERSRQSDDRPGGPDP